MPRLNLTLLPLLVLAALGTSAPIPPAADPIIDAASLRTAQSLYLTTANEFINIADRGHYVGSRPAVDKIVALLRAYKYPVSEAPVVESKKKEKEGEEEEEGSGQRVDLRKRQVKKEFDFEEEEEEEEWFGRPVMNVEKKRGLAGDMGNRLIWEEQVAGTVAREGRSLKGEMGERLIWEEQQQARRLAGRAVGVVKESDPEDEFFALDEGKGKRAVGVVTGEDPEDEFFALNEKRAVGVVTDEDPEDDFFALGGEKQ